MINIHYINGITTESFNIKIYSQNKNLILNLNDIVLAESPRQISDSLLAINGVNLIEVFDKTDNLLLISSNILPENIDNYE